MVQEFLLTFKKITTIPANNRLCKILLHLNFLCVLTITCILFVHIVVTLGWMLKFKVVQKKTKDKTGLIGKGIDQALQL